PRRQHRASCPRAQPVAYHCGARRACEWVDDGVSGRGAEKAEGGGMTREIPLYTLQGVKDAEATTHWFTTEDGLGLSLLRFCRAPARDVVVIIHGLTTSSDMFIQPEHYNLVSYLLDHDFTDVWTLDFRMSNRHSYNLLPNDWSMDDCAVYD